MPTARPINALGCSAHWFEVQPTWKDGGMLAAGYYEHDTHFLKVSTEGQIRRVGYFPPHAGSTSAAYWINRNIVYAVDYTRGIDILRYNGPGTNGPLTDANQNGTGGGGRPPEIGAGGPNFEGLARRTAFGGGDSARRVGGGEGDSAAQQVRPRYRTERSRHVVLDGISIE